MKAGSGWTVIGMGSAWILAKLGRAMRARRAPGCVKSLVGVRMGVLGTAAFSGPSAKPFWRLMEAKQTALDQWKKSLLP